ncbi:glycosyl hydrolase family 39 [Krasilnikovia cinnamomea]|uniref:Glycosyl hydrolase family 39 n=1 Tax=Krasilnikovia cinnamomea TaxID=349313 RepID=A0A4Q7ZQK7_9ACTN|nr:hypothetical protein [Krasilnikovia cinnamomea]RZU53408.1 glycosyl hydrolase family 39 [Krasilnikovia cinnamomea]
MFLLHHRRWLAAGVAVLTAAALGIAPAAAAPSADDEFDSTAIGALPAGWTGSGGQAAVAELPATRDRSLRLTDTSASTSTLAGRSFAATSDPVVVSLRLRAEQSSAVIGVHLDGPQGRAVTVALDDSANWYSYRGAQRTTLRGYTADRWYDLRIVARPATDTATVYLDGRLLASGLTFRSPVDTLDHLQITVSRSGVGAVWVDDVRIEAEAAAASWPSLGVVRPRDAGAIGASSVSVGGETLDRDYTDYASYRRYLDPLGATGIRMQTGWAKTERTRGVYDFGWLRSVVDDATARGVRPWLSVSYGNPAVYGSAGGEIGSGGRLPTGEGLTAWGNYVDALVTEFRGAVDEWEVWNEPDLRDQVPPEQYADFLIFTARRIRAAQSNARIYGVAAAGLWGNPSYPEQVLSRLAELGKLHLVTAVTYHAYSYNPDQKALYDQIAKVRGRLAGIAPGVSLRMGEGGAPSRSGGTGALAEQPWTPVSQAKWDLRRLIADLGNGVPTNVFGISDMRYGAPPAGINDKGLLRIHDDTRAVRYAKPAYYSIQAAASVLDGRLTPTRSSGATVDGRDAAVHTFRNAIGRQAVALWLRGGQEGIPSAGTTREFATVTVPAGNFTDPVYVDLRTAEVYDIPDGSWSRSGATYTFTGVPVYDSPVLLADRSLVPL